MVDDMNNIAKLNRTARILLKYIYHCGWQSRSTEKQHKSLQNRRIFFRLVATRYFFFVWL